MEFSIKQIAEYLNAEVVGDENLKLNNLSKIEESLEYDSAEASSGFGDLCGEAGAKSCTGPLP